MKTIEIELPVRRKYLFPNMYTFETGIFDIEPVKYERVAVYRTGEVQEYFYFAFFDPPAGVLVEDGSVRQHENGTIRGLIDRLRNPDWLPPQKGWDWNYWYKEKNEVNHG